MNEKNERTPEELGEEFDKFRRDTRTELDNLKKEIEKLKSGAVTVSGT